MFALFGTRRVYQMEEESNSSISPKKRWPLVLIISVTVTLVLISSGIIAGIVLTRKNEPSESSPVFQMQTQRLVKTMNSSCDRCNDFYGYVCGLFGSQYVLPPLATRFDLRDVAKEDVHDKLRSQFNETEPKFKFTKYLSTFYNECSSVKKDLEKLKQFFVNVNQPPDTNSLMAKALVYIGSSIVDLKVKPNPFVNGAHALWISQPKFNILPQDLAEENSEIVSTYKNYIETQSTPVLSFSQRELIDDAIKLESDLAKRTTNESERTYLIATLGDLAKYSGKIDWTQVFTKVRDLLSLEEPLTPETAVVIDGSSYFTSLESVLSKYSDETVNVYILLRLLQSYGFSMANQDSSDFYYMRQSNLDMSAFNRSHRCMEVLIDTVPHLMGRLLYDSDVDGRVSGEMVEKVTQMANNIKSVFIDQIKNNGWIGEDTKKKLISKIQSNLVKVAYPQFLSQDQVMDDAFQLQPKNDSSAGDLLIELKKFSLANQFKQLKEPVNATTWTLSSASCDVNYDPLTNSLTIPAGALHQLFFDLQQPDYINYAGLGVSIAHQLMHAFLRHRICFDETGLANGHWLPKTFMEDLSSKSSCLVGSMCEINKQFESNIDGFRTLDENLADVQALKLAYESFNKFAPDESLISVRFTQEKDGQAEDQMSSAQLFLIFYQSNFCQIETQYSTRVVEKFDPHVASKMRSVVPILNLNQFAHQFNCTSESKFAFQANCPVW